MKKIRYYLAVIALLATLSGSILPVLGMGSIANAVASHHSSATFVAGKSAPSVAFILKGPCPTGGESDC